MLSTHIVTLSFFLLLITNLPQSHCQQQPPGYYGPACTEQPYNCGDLSITSYPFWGESRPSYCGGGEPFKLNCQNNETTTISIQSQNFTVLHIKPTDYTMKMKRTDLDIDVCSPQFNDTYLNPNLFQYSPTVRGNITIFYNCSSHDFPNSTSMCGPKNTAICHVGLEDNLLEEFASFRRCKRHIQVPAGFSLDRFYEKGVVIEHRDLVLGLEEGFEVRYFVNEECMKCMVGSDDEDQCRWKWNTPPAEFDKLVKSCYYCQDGSVASSTNCSAAQSDNKSNPFNWKTKIVIGVGSAVTATLLICITICCFRSKMSIRQVRLQLTTKSDKDIEAFLKNYGALSQKRYKFSEVKKMTNSFNVTLGQGGFGTVYKGKLPSGVPVAVKVLKASKGNGEEFINEVASISRTSHVNVVSLMGFCFEDCKKALIYEFMPKGSLDNFIYNRGSKTIASLRWDTLYKIAKGIARGLEYLHRGCATRILHFDIKPHNILLDENLCPKISDFGLAKLCPKKESIISMSDARGSM